MSVALAGSSGVAAVFHRGALGAAVLAAAAAVVAATWLRRAERAAEPRPAGRALATHPL